MPVLSLQQTGLSFAAIGIGFEICSALQSSPWTAENFGADPAKAASAMEYLYMSMGVTELLGAGFSLLAESPAPIIGTTAVCIFMYWIYRRALGRGQAANSTGWQNMPAPLVSGGNGNGTQVNSQA
jgi:hypothetical protein